MSSILPGLPQSRTPHMEPFRPIQRQKEGMQKQGGISMKRFVFIFSVLAALGLLLAGCSLGSIDADGQEDADGIAAMATDPAEGLSQEVADIGAFIFGGSGGAGAEQKALGLPDGRARFFSGDLANFTWNPVTEAYERSRTDFDLALPTR